MINVVAGIDIGGTFTKFGLVDKQGRVYGNRSVATDTRGEVESYLEKLCESLRALIDRNRGKINLVGIGLGAPKGNYYSGAIEYAHNLKWEGVIPFSSMRMVGVMVGTKILEAERVTETAEMLLISVTTH